MVQVASDVFLVMDSIWHHFSLFDIVNSIDKIYIYICRYFLKSAKFWNLIFLLDESNKLKIELEKKRLTAIEEGTCQ